MPQDRRYYLAKARGVRETELELFGADEAEKRSRLGRNERHRERKRDERLAQKPLGGLTFDDFDRNEP